MSRQSGWNQHYHQGQGYDTRGAGVEEKGVSPSDPSFWATDPRAPPASVLEVEDGNKEALESETDEEYARRLYREEADKQARSKQYAQYGDGSYHNTSGEPGNYYTSGQPEQNEAVIPPAPYLKPKAPKRPFFTYIASAIQIVMLIYSIVYNNQQTGSPFSPFQNNPMIGPGAPALIQLGARFVLCMRNITGLTASTQINSCPTSTGGITNCSLESFCGLGGFHGGPPNQWDRFIIPIFLHAGIIHILFNLLFQLTTGIQVERSIGWWRYGIIYMASGTFGFIFGGNFAAPAIPSMGASGSLFGIIGLLLIDILQSWKLIVNPCWELTKLLLMIIFSFLLGLLPGLDNFSHIGGFVMGLITGLALNPTNHFSKIHKYANLILRIVAVVISALLFYLLIQNFYAGDPSEKCPWCKYLSCLPFTGWCDSKIGTANISQGS